MRFVQGRCWRLVPLVILLATDCKGAKDCAAGECVGPTDVAITRSVTRWNEDGTSSTTPAADSGAVAIDAILPDGTVIPAVRTGSTWVVRDVPTGSYRLRIVDEAGRPTLVDTSARSVDLGWDEPARADVTYPTLPTVATLGLSGLSPWSASDQLQLFSWGARIYDELPEAVAPGATAGSSAYDFLTSGLYPPDALLAAEDRLFVMQQRWAACGTGSCRSVLAVGSATGVAMADGVATSIPLPMTPVQPSRTATVDWRVTQFEAHLAEMGAGATVPLDPHVLYVVAVPSAARVSAAIGASPDLLQVSVPVGVDADLGQVRYGNFFTGTSPYHEHAVASFTGRLPRIAPDGRTVNFWAVMDREDATVPVPLVPAITPPTSVRIAGLDANVAHTGVGTEPTISWAAPRVGTPELYTVWIYELPGDPAATAKNVVLTLRTSASEVTLPSGALAAGRSYVAMIEAGTGEGTPAAPFRLESPRARARFVSQPFSP